MRREWLEELVVEIRSRAPDQILLTGDLTHFGRFFGHEMQDVLVLPPGTYLRSRM